MPAQLPIADELSDDLAALLPLVRLAVRGEATPGQLDALGTRYDAALAKSNELASALRVVVPFLMRGRTPHTVAQAKRYLNATLA